FSEKWKFGIPKYASKVKSRFIKDKITLWNVEEEIWIAIRVIFFPILGILLFGTHVIYRWKIQLFNKKSINIHNYPTLLLNSSLAVIAFLALLFGVIISFSVIYYGYKWELSRFNMIGVTLCMIGLIVFIDSSLSKAALLVKNKILVPLCFFMMIGPINGYLNIFYENVKHHTIPEYEKEKTPAMCDSPELTFMERYCLLIDHSFLNVSYVSKCFLPCRFVKPDALENFDMESSVLPYQKNQQSVR
ncbi:MAG: hypothetical protein HQL73_07145, partial [Magnetococcales bacterium]|nr:hypothetical protein [Magnetococcales bacterium]